MTNHGSHTDRNNAEVPVHTNCVSAWQPLPRQRHECQQLVWTGTIWKVNKMKPQQLGAALFMCSKCKSNRSWRLPACCLELATGYSLQTMFIYWLEFAWCSVGVYLKFLTRTNAEDSPPHPSPLSHTWNKLQGKKLIKDIMKKNQVNRNFPIARVRSRRSAHSNSYQLNCALIWMDCALDMFIQK